MRYSEARGTLNYEKNLKSKISCQTPFKYIYLLYMKITEAKIYFIFERLKQVVLIFKRKWQKLLAGTWQT
jgi:hypothetical protein